MYLNKNATHIVMFYPCAFENKKKELLLRLVFTEYLLAGLTHKLINYFTHITIL